MKIKKCSSCQADCYLWKSSPPLCKDCARKYHKPLKSVLTPEVIKLVDDITISSLKLAMAKRKVNSIPKVSTKQAKLNRAYMVLRNQFIKCNPLCDAQLENCTIRSTELHHSRGRGEYLLDSTTFIALCHNCHAYLEIHPNEAKELGYSLSRLDKEL